MSDAREGQAVTRRWGKWSQPGVPHKGWSCEGTDDLGPDRENWQTCEMCEAMEIRYVHSMTHPDYPGQLDCGCVCAGHMEQDLQAARDREASMKKSAKQRIAFPRRREWRVSTNGNPTIRIDGWLVTVFARGVGYRAVVSRNGEKYWLPQSGPAYATTEDAKLAAFDAISDAARKAG
ncbi:MAG TPA: hypothetical protein VNR39_03680 [Pseudolabrys sp.]|nr:hypothetical protein [Pseudolabrys sp.]